MTEIAKVALKLRLHPSNESARILDGQSRITS
jgi:hypothetical protein